MLPSACGSAPNLGSIWEPHSNAARYRTCTLTLRPCYRPRNRWATTFPAESGNRHENASQSVRQWPFPRTESRTMYRLSPVLALACAFAGCHGHGFARPCGAASYSDPTPAQSALPQAAFFATDIWLGSKLAQNVGEGTQTATAFSFWDRTMPAHRYEQELTDTAYGHGTPTKEPPSNRHLRQRLTAERGRLPAGSMAIRHAGDCRCVRAQKKSTKTGQAAPSDPRFPGTSVADRGRIRATSDPKRRRSAARMDRLQSVGIPNLVTPQSRTMYRLCAAFALLLVFVSQSPAADPKPLEFRLTFDQSALDTPFTGRVFVMFRTNSASPPAGINWFRPGAGACERRQGLEAGRAAHDQRQGRSPTRGRSRS